MPEPADQTELAHSNRHREFFRHSGWLMAAGLGAGGVAWLLHFLARKMSPADYGLFNALMAVVTCIPAMPLQMVFTHQAAAALASGREAEVAGLVRRLCAGAALLWILFCIVVIVFRGEIMFRWETANITALMLLLPAVLLSILMPIFSGLLQGEQNFLWLGWGNILSTSARVGIAAVAVIAFGAGAAGLMIGVIAGLATALAIALWQTQRLWRRPAAPSNWTRILREAIPLMIGFGAFQFLFNADIIFAKAYFGADNVGFYTGAGILSRALMWVVGPMAQVMFPRVVHSTARSQQTDIMIIVFIGTAILAICGAIGLSLLGPWVVGFVFGANFVQVASELLPWYAAAIVPLTLANVLLNNLLARGTWKIAPAMAVLVGIYILGLTQFHASLVQVLQVFGVSNLLLLLTCAFYTWRGAAKPATVA